MKHIIIKTPRGKRKIGPGQPTFIVAEMSGNHNQSYARAKKIIDAAAAAGADAVKLQTYTADTLTIDSDKKYFRIKFGPWAGKTLYQLYQEAYTPWAWQMKLKQYAEKKGLLLFSTPFDATAVDWLEKINVTLYKVASFEIVDIPLLKKIGKTRKPVIISRGLASLAEIKLAIKTLKENGTPQVAILHCVSSYPALPAQMNLATITDIAKRLGVVSGLSDHTLSTAVPIAAVALGAAIIEKHLTLKRAEGGPDAAFSLEPAEFKNLVQTVRIVEKALGKVSYGAGKNELPNLVFRRSLFVIQDIKKGEKFTKENIRSIRPGYGLAPKHWFDVIGKRARRNISRGRPLSWDLIWK